MDLALLLTRRHCDETYKLVTWYTPYPILSYPRCYLSLYLYLLRYCREVPFDARRPVEQGPAGVTKAERQPWQMPLERLHLISRLTLCGWSGDHAITRLDRYAMTSEPSPCSHQKKVRPGYPTATVQLKPCEMDSSQRSGAYSVGRHGLRAGQ